MTLKKSRRLILSGPLPGPAEEEAEKVVSQFLRQYAITSAFCSELAESEKTGNLPQLCVITLNKDHTNGTRPGSPTPRAMVADNDLALGRVVEGLSKSRFWSSSVMLVVEDDAPNA